MPRGPSTVNESLQSYSMMNDHAKNPGAPGATVRDPHHPTAGRSQLGVW